MRSSWPCCRAALAASRASSRTATASAVSWLALPPPSRWGRCSMEGRGTYIVGGAAGCRGKRPRQAAGGRRVGGKHKHTAFCWRALGSQRGLTVPNQRLASGPASWTVSTSVKRCAGGCARASGRWQCRRRDPGKAAEMPTGGCKWLKKRGRRADISSTAGAMRQQLTHAWRPGAGAAVHCMRVCIAVLAGHSAVGCESQQLVSNIHAGRRASPPLQLAAHQCWTPGMDIRCRSKLLVPRG